MIAHMEFAVIKTGKADFSIIPNSELENFEVFVVQDIEDSGDALDFGKLKNI